jgi:hypothetical protein
MRDVLLLKSRLSLIFFCRVCIKLCGHKASRTVTFLICSDKALS